jgi:uncharacterized membrane protein
MDRRFGRVLHLVRAIVCWGPGAVDDVIRNDRRRREVWSPRAPGAVILIRLLVGLVFFEEGLQKFLFPAVMGAGRFVRIGIPAPAVIGPFVGVVEIVCGTMLALGLLPAGGGSAASGHHGGDPLDQAPHPARTRLRCARSDAKAAHPRAEAIGLRRRVSVCAAAGLSFGRAGGPARAREHRGRPSRKGGRSGLHVLTHARRIIPARRRHEHGWRSDPYPRRLRFRV